MQPEQAIESFHLLGNEIKDFLKGTSVKQDEWNNILLLAEQDNPWFTKENIISALANISRWLNSTDVERRLLSGAETSRNITHQPLNIGVVMAGNIPLVGFHDFLCVLLSGNILYAKLSHTDKRLLPFIAGRLIEIEPEWKGSIHFAEKLNVALDAVIATGSNNTARHFEYYFRNIPHIIRKNRNGIAILDGSETTEELTALGKDIFSYFGLGCRNVSKLYVPKGYVFDDFFRAIEEFGKVINHNKYHSNYVYNRTIYLMDGKKFTDNNFLIVIENTHTSSPIAVLNFEEYESIEKLNSHLEDIREQIQCIVSKKWLVADVERRLLSGAETSRNISGQWAVPFGETQSPSLTDYADGVDVMKFLEKLATNTL